MLRGYLRVRWCGGSRELLAKRCCVSRFWMMQAHWHSYRTDQEIGWKPFRETGEGNIAFESTGSGAFVSGG